MGSFSIKWKLSLALIAIGLSLVLGYVLVAKRVFESDKISYVFEAQGSKLSALKRSIEQTFQSSMLTARGVIAAYDQNRGVLSRVGEQMLREDAHVLALELINESSKQTIYRTEKEEGLLALGQNLILTTAPQLGIPDVYFLSPTRLLLVLRYGGANGESPYRLNVVVDSAQLLPLGEPSQTLLLAQEGKILMSTKVGNSDQQVFEKIALDGSADELDQTKMWSHQSSRFLVSSASLNIGRLKVVAVTPEETALGALDTLFQRSILFLGFSLFGLIAVSILLAKTLTQNLRRLTLAADEIGQGHFDDLPVIKAQDEMGVLSRAFIKMSHEIKRLLNETRDKARMEAELKTARLVQERLLPSQSTYEFGEFEINGVVLTSTECGGDWWYYFKRGNEVIVAIADATGHGTPAALITAAARSIFSRLEKENLSLGEMLSAWDLAVSSCSQRKVFMTGILFRINLDTGDVSYISAGHESPFLFQQTPEGDFDAHMLQIDVNNSIGDGLEVDLKEQHLKLEPNASLVLYTDGIFSVERPDGKKLSEKRLVKAIAAKAEYARSATAMTDLLLKSFNDHRENNPVPDDVTVVTIRRKGPDRISQVISEAGDLQAGAAPT